MTNNTFDHWTAAIGSAVLGWAALLALAAAPAPATTGDTNAPLYAKMKQRFTTTQSGAWTGWRFDGALKPYAPGVQPPPQRSATLVFPRGTRFDLSGAPSCDASVEEITSGGIGVCPKRSKFVTGTASLFIGAAGNINANVHIFVARPGMVVAFTSESGSVLRVFTASVNRNRVIAMLPAFALPGGYEVSVLGMSLKGRRFGTRKHPGIRTPDRCPKSGRWTFTYLPRYDPPYGVQRSTSSVRCTRARSGPR